MINILVNGAHGKMGTVLKHCVDKTPDLSIEYEIDKDTLLSFESLDSSSQKPDVIIDFSTPEASLSALDYAACHLIPIVIATTGFVENENNKIKEYSQAIPIFQSSNMSYLIHLIGLILHNISPLLSYIHFQIAIEKKDGEELQRTADFLYEEGILSKKLSVEEYIDYDIAKGE